MRVGFLILCIAVCGCGPEEPQAGPPPVEFSFRKSQVPFKGVVAGIRNVSTDETLEDLVVHVTAPGAIEVRSYRLDGPVLPQDSITVGWAELDGWELRPGQTLSVSCGGYRRPATTAVPEF